MSHPRLGSPFVLFAFVLAITFASSAQAGFWEVVYDLAPGSNLHTVNPGGEYDDPITGSLTIHYDAASSGAPLSGARLVAGDIQGSINQPAGVLTVTGTNMNVLTPGPGGTPGTLTGNSLNLGVVADHTLSGYLHCFDGTGTGGFCDIFFGTPSSNTIPQQGSGTFTFPRFDFTGATAGVGDFTSTAVTSQPQPSVTTTVVYRGREISRTFMPEPGSVAMLVPGALLLLGLGAARRSRTR